MVNGRKKGQGAERKLVKLFEAWWGTRFFRTPGSGAFATRGFMDMDLSNMAGDIVTVDKSFPFCVESKKVEGWTLEQMLTSDKTKMHDWWEQTTRETPTGKIPLLVFTKNHAPLYVMMCWRDMVSELTVVQAARRQIFHFDMRTATGEYEAVAIFSLDHLLKTKKENWLYDR